MGEIDNVAVFLDTLDLCEQNYKSECDTLIKGAKFYSRPSQVPVPKADPISNVEFRCGGSMQTAYAEAGKGGRVAVLDFADALKPGGYPELGAFTQEENMCRCSNLFFALEAHTEYYTHHKSVNNEVYTDGILYVPNVMMFKDDTTYKRIPARQFDVIVCPAPSTDVPFSVLSQRANCIVKLAAYKNVDTLILGAWGCGAFGQDPYTVGKAFGRALNLYNYFDKVIFAVRPTIDLWGASNYTPLSKGFCSIYKKDVEVL